jgi:hypothetical protein
VRKIDLDRSKYQGTFTPESSLCFYYCDPEDLKIWKDFENSEKSKKSKNQKR